MSVAAAAPNTLDLRRIADTFAPGRFRFDLFGLASGYKAYLIYTGLAARSDRDLAALGLDRRDLPRVAIQAADGLRVA